MFTDLQRVLHDYWERFLYLSPKLIVALVVISVTLLVARRASTLLGSRLQARAHDPLLAEFLTGIAKWALLLAGILLAMQVIGLTGVVSGVLGAAGLSAFVVGFALKDIAENFLAGMVLAFNRPFRVHDTVQIRDLVGHVEALNLRTTMIKTFDGKHIFLPNAMVLREPLTNFTHDDYIRQDFLVSVNYGEDPGSDRVMNLIKQYVNSEKGVQKDSPNTTYLTLEKSEGTTADIRVYFWALSEDYHRGVIELKSSLMQGVKARLIEAGYAQPIKVQ
ncbi:MAG TPA: mechanosensitive ion channel domain-containing protein [Hymenobacter sp.]